jgi:hypothetical protein
MAFLKMNCLVMDPDLPDGTKIQDKTTTVLVDLDSILIMEENKGYYSYGDKALTNIHTKQGENLCAIGSLEEIARLIEEEEGCFVIDLTTLKSE